MNKILNVINEKINRKDKILLMLSGGPDSVFLFNIFKELKLNFSCFHLNHKLRGESSDADEVFVKELCLKNNIGVFCDSIDLKDESQKMGQSLEHAGRTIRYKKAVEYAEKNKINIIVTAHNKEDNIESFFINLFRGTGFSGLTGIKDKIIINNNLIIIRPLLNISRKYITAYLEEKNIKYRIDETNNNPDFQRNRIRHNLVPLLKKDYNKKIEDIIIRTINICDAGAEHIKKELENLINSNILTVEDNTVILNLPAVKELDRIILTELIRSAIKTLRKINSEKYEMPDSFLSGIEYKHIQDTTALIYNKQSGKYIELPHSIKVTKTQDSLIFSLYNLIQKKDYFYKIKEEGELLIEETGIKIIISRSSYDEYLMLNKDKNNAFFTLKDLDLIVRNRKNSDSFYPSKFSGKKKKLKKIFIDNKVQIHLRDKIPLFEYQGDIIWIPGYRQSKFCIPDENDSNIFRIEIEGYTSPFK